MKKIICCIFLLFSLHQFLMPQTTGRISLAGDWRFELDSADIGEEELWYTKTLINSIKLPGITDEGGYGPEVIETGKLSRLHKYIGKAWYQMDISIPENWKNKNVSLCFERIMWKSKLWLNDQYIDAQESLLTPHYYFLGKLSPGTYRLTLCIDNREIYPIGNEWGHSYGEQTQIIWNGIIGEMIMSSHPDVQISQIRTFPDDTGQLDIEISVLNRSQKEQKAKLCFELRDRKTGKVVNTMESNCRITSGRNRIVESLKVSDVKLWDEFSPSLYELNCSLMSKLGNDVYEPVIFGFRSIGKTEDYITVNGLERYLRGNLDCAVFPLTGYPATDKKSWLHILRSYKDFGLNHVRFHSWTPPKAAFEAADEMGFYLQVELPAWVLTIGQDSSAVRFLREEADRIIKNYGNHPSFCLWSLGNELQGDFTILSAMLDELKAKDNRHLYVTTSFTFEGGHGGWPESNDDFFVTQWTNKGWVRGQGVFNQLSPTFDKDYSESVAGIQVPLITHEIGQYSVYPDLTEISKYTGVLKPLNFMAVKNDLEKKKLLDKAPDYLMASGKLAAILYKEEIERALKTDGISGFQLLDLHDFPGQGTALVGLLNAFWESKGIIDGKAFREFCSPVVPLLRFPKAVYKNNEVFQAEIELCNYGNDILTNKTLHWDILDKGRSVKHGEIQVGELKFGYNGKLGEISVPLTDIQNASKLEVCVKVIGTDYVNRWNIWVYPEGEKVEWGNVKYTRNYDQAMAWLNEGQKVLFNPDWKKMKGIEGKFVPVFWSPVHFPNQAGTMGVLCNPAHKALADFPTDMHTDWQWWDLNKNSKTMITDSIQGGTPIVEMVDNFTNNRRLASLYEGKVRGGKLVLATFDLQSDLENRPVAKQMLVSLLKYMNSTDFDPTIIENFEEIKDMFDKNSK